MRRSMTVTSSGPLKRGASAYLMLEKVKSLMMF